jgi:hypothetical protein
MEMVFSFCAESAVVEVDEVGHKVRPASKRRTIILREIPEGTKHEVWTFCALSRVIG